MDPGRLAPLLPALTPLEFGLLLGVLALLLAGSTYAALKALRRARLIEDVPTSRIRSAAQGYVELDGTGSLLEGEPIVAPLSGIPCTWYRYRVDHKEARGDGRSRHRVEWRPVERGVSDGLFLLVDDTGRCVIDPDGAEVTPVARDVWYGGSARPGRPPGKHRFRALVGSTYRYREERMHPGDPLYAIGELQTIGGADSGGDVNEEVRATLQAWKRDPARMQRFDRNGDGHVDVQEWAAARAAARAEVLAARARHAAEPGVPVLRKPGDPRLPFLLSATPQSGLARRFRWYARGAALLGVLSGAALLWVLQARGGP